MPQEYAIPGFSKYTLVLRPAGEWAVIGVSGKRLRGTYRPPSPRWFFCMQSDHKRVAVLQLGRIVLLALVGPPPPGTECCHRDGDPSNNDPGNLYWGTDADNALDAKWHAWQRAENRKQTPRPVAVVYRRIPMGTGTGTVIRPYGMECVDKRAGQDIAPSVFFGDGN